MDPHSYRRARFLATMALCGVLVVIALGLVATAIGDPLEGEPPPSIVSGSCVILAGFALAGAVLSLRILRPGSVFIVVVTVAIAIAGLAGGLVLLT